MSDPAVALVNNPELLHSLQTTDGIAAQVIDDTTAQVTTAVEDQANDRRNAAIRDSVIVRGRDPARAARRAAGGARRWSGRCGCCATARCKVAHEDLAREIDRVRAGDEPGRSQPLPVHTTEEIGQVAHAVDELHEQAVLLAGEQARLQLQVSDMFETLSRRSRSLVDQQLSLIDRLERNEEDPERLDSLFRLDHLAARMRRNGANLLVLAGAQGRARAGRPGAGRRRSSTPPPPRSRTTRRVVTRRCPTARSLGVVAGDLVHLLAELLDNALRYSPPSSQVRVSAVHTGNGGLVIEVSDDGLGMTESDLRVANTRLQSGGEVNPYTARHMGLFVVGRLAAPARDLVVRLRSPLREDRTRAPPPVSTCRRRCWRAPSDGSTARSAIGHAATPAVVPLPSAADRRTVRRRRQSTTPLDRHRPSATARYAEPSVSLLPQRNPGASGISGVPAALAGAARADRRRARTEPARSSPETEPGRSRRSEHVGVLRLAEPVRRENRQAPKRAGRTGARGRARTPAATTSGRRAASPAAGTPRTIRSTRGCCPSGWSTRTSWRRAPTWTGRRCGTTAGRRPRSGRETPGRRRTPSTACRCANPAPGWCRAPPDERPNGHAHHRAGDGDDYTNGGSPRRCRAPPRAPVRDPDAVRATISSHFGGVHAGRSHARERARNRSRMTCFRPPAPRESLDWLVSKFAREVPGVSHAILVSADGLLMAASEHMPKRARRPAGGGGVRAGQPGDRCRAAVRRRPGAAVGGRDGERLPAADARRRRLASGDAGRDVVRHRPDRLRDGHAGRTGGQRRAVVPTRRAGRRIVSRDGQHASQRGSEPPRRGEPGPPVHPDVRTHQASVDIPLEAPVQTLQSAPVPPVAGQRCAGQDHPAVCQEPVGGRDIGSAESCRSVSRACWSAIW